MVTPGGGGDCLPQLAASLRVLLSARQDAMTVCDLNMLCVGNGMSLTNNASQENQVRRYVQSGRPQLL